MNNGFPKFTVEKCIRGFLDKKYNSTQVEQILDADPVLNFVFPYFGPQSEKLKLDIEKILGKYFSNLDFRIILVNNFKIGNFFKFKDSIPRAVRSSLVYQYSCVQCTSSHV